MKSKLKIYAILNIRDKTLKEYHLIFDDFGKVCCKYSQDIISFGECNKFVNPYVHFIQLSHAYITNEYNELVEILENKTYAQMEELFQKLF